MALKPHTRHLLLFDNHVDFFAGLRAFRAGPERVYVAHLLGYMQIRVYTSGFHFIVAVDDVGVEYLPGPRE